MFLVCDLVFIEKVSFLFCLLRVGSKSVNNIFFEDLILWIMFILLYMRFGMVGILDLWSSSLYWKLLYLLNMFEVG